MVPIKAKAGLGVCLIQSNKGISKVKVANNKGELYCMYKGKRYILNKRKLSDSDYVSVILTRAKRRKVSYGRKRTNSRRKRKSKRLPRKSFKRSKSKN